ASPLRRSSVFLSLQIPRSSRTTLFPYTTLFRSKIKLEDVRLQFGYVMQDVFLFSNTIDANIAFFNPDISHEEVVKAAKAAQAHEDRKSTRLNSSHVKIPYAVFCLKKKTVSQDTI